MKQQLTSFFYKSALLTVVLALIIGCSRKKDKWLNRNFHAMGTYYNILFHGDQALDMGQQQVNQNYVDDYWEVLPLERMKETDDSVVYGTMVEPSEFKMPDRSAFAKSREKSQQNKAEKEPKKKNVKSDKKSASDAFKNFDNKKATTGNQQNKDNRRGQNNRGNRQNMNGGRGIDQGNFNGRNSGNQFNNSSGNQRNSMNQGNVNQGNSIQNNAPQNNPSGNNSQFNGSNNSRMTNGGRSNNTTMGGGNRGGRQNGGGMRPRSMNNSSSGGRMTQNSGGRNTNANGFSRNISNSVSGQSSNRSRQSGGASSSREEKLSLSTDEAFERAEEKATKAIQKHNMLINGEEHNPQMKDAFLLLGKARYFDQRYFPALEAFNYIIHKYEDEDYIVTAQIWREKTYMRLENYDRVIENLTSLLNKPEKLDDQDVVDAASALAQTYLETDQDKKAVKPLNMAIKATDDHSLKGRYLYAKGQIFENLKEIDSANAAYDQVIELNRKSPRIYMVHAYMEKAKHFDLTSGGRAKQLDTLKEMLDDRENRPFLDVINYQTAQNYKDVDSMKTAVDYYNKALRTGTSDHGLRYRTYKTLGNYYFDQASYKKAGAYYDSTMVNLPEDSREYRTFRRKRINLDGVIFYEDVARKNDSILRLVHMDPEKRQAYFKKYTDSLKAAAVARAKKAEKEAKRSKRGNMFGQRRSQAGRGATKFYFYDPQMVQSGQHTFKQIWGDRDLQDNWRTEKRHSSKKEGDEEEETDFMAAIESNPDYKVETYLDQIPKDEEIIDSLSDARNFAYYQLGIIYNEKFSEYQLAADKLEKLLKNDPEERLILPSKYNLYKIYQKLGASSKAAHWKENILADHPDSRYAKILRNPKSLRDEKTSPEKVYYKLYKTYKKGQYEQVVNRCDKEITRFTGDDIVPKMELLKAMATGRLYGLKEYKKALNYVALNYPQTTEGKKAEEIVNKTLPKLEKEKFVKKAEGNYNLVYTFSKDKESITKFKGTLDKALKKLDFKDLDISVDIYSPQKTFVIVRGLHSKMGAEGLGDKLKKEKDYQIERTYFGISSKNYEILLRHKNLEQYKQEFVNQ